MARFSYTDVDKYGAQGGSGFFRLVNDKDTAEVRLMYRSVDDVEAMSVHQVTINNKRRWANCIREYNEPKDACPFCRSGMPQFVRLFIPLYNISQDRVQIWDRGKTFIGKITAYCSKFKNPGKIYEIERNGAAGDQKTTYEMYPIDDDDTKMEDLPEFEDNILGGIVLDKTAEDMEYYLETGEFPPEDDDEEDEAPVRRRSSSSKKSRRREEEEEDDVPFDDYEEEEERPRRRSQSRKQTEQRSGRRTPSSRNRDAF